MKQFNQSAKLMLAVPVLVFLTSCSQAKFKIYSDAAGGGDDVQLVTPVVCDPFDSSNIVSPTSGLKGSIHYLTPGQPLYHTSTDIINNGARVNADLFLNAVDVPEREWTAGFVSDSGSIRNDSGQLLTEWFALNLDSKLKLAPGEAAGDYQLAILSDDGSRLSLKNSAGVYEVVVDHEGDHSPVLGCASQVVTMTTTTAIPLNLRYYQGPRNRIALSVLWRKIPTGGSLSEVECGRGGNDYFYNHGTATTPATPRAPYTDLLSRGWKPLSNSNFELQAGSNLCSL